AKLVRNWQIPMSTAPAGSSLCATATDVIGFARSHLDGGGPVLSVGSVSAMQEPQVKLPNPWTLGSHWGLGWILFHWDGRRLIGHDGGTFGQGSFLRIVPDEGVAIALLTNGGHARDMYEDLYRELLLSLCDMQMPRPLGPPDEPVTVEVDRHVGVYER